jgi:hypothetical protein
MRISAAEVEWQTEVVSGTYRLASVDVPRNRYRVEWVRRGAVDLFQEAMTLIPSKPGSAIPDGDTIEVRVSLLPAKPFRKVSGRFLGADIPSIVSLNDSDGGSAQSAVDSNGNFEFERVSPGIHRLYAGGSYLDPAPTTIAVTDDDVLNVGVTVPGQREIRGRVHIEGGGTLPPLALLVWHEWTLGQLNVGLTPRGGQGVPLTIFADGAFEISMPEGSHRIEVTGFPAAFYRLISVDFGGSDVLKGRLTVTGTTLPELLIKLQLVDADIMAGLHGKLRATTGSRPNRVALSGQNPQLASLKLFATLLQDGSYNFERVPAGTYSLGTDPPVAGMLPRHVTLQASQTAEADLNVPAIIRTKVSVRAEGRQLADPRITFTIRLNTGEAYRVYPSPVFTYVQPLGTRCLGDVCSYRPSGAHLNEPAGVLGSNTAGSFDMLLPEGDHRIEIDTAPQGFRLKSALQGDIDLLKSPLRIGNGPAEILLTVE